MKPTDVIATVDGLLDQARPAIVEKLRPLVTRQPPADEIFCSLELFHTQDFSLNLNRHLRVHKNGKDILQAEYECFDAEPTCCLPQVLAYLDEACAQVDWSEAEATEFDEAHEAQLVRFFSDCWREAGGERSLTKLYFSLDKEYRCRDLFSGEIMSDTEVAASLGHDLPLM